MSSNIANYKPNLSMDCQNLLILAPFKSIDLSCAGQFTNYQNHCKWVYLKHDDNNLLGNSWQLE